MSERIKRLQVNFDISGATGNQRSIKFAREKLEKFGDRFGKPKNKSERAERRRARNAIGNTEEFQLKRALGKISTGTETPEDRAFVQRRAEEFNMSVVVPANGLNGDPEVFNISDLVSPRPTEEY